MRRDGRLGVGVIGAGRVGPVIGAALGGAGHAIVGITRGADEERAEAVLPASRGSMPWRSSAAVSSW